MKAKTISLLLVLVMLLAPLFTYAQSIASPKPVYSHTLSVSSPTTVSQDRNGAVYVLGPQRNLLRLDALGQPLDTFSPPTRGRISTMEAWNPMKVLLFYEDSQTLLLLDRFLRPLSSTDLRDINYGGIAKVAALSSDDGVWLFDETNLTLSKLDLRQRNVTLETPLNLILDRERFDVLQLREYQNQLYLLDSNNGLYVFDNLGNYKQQIPLSGVRYVGFRDNELYYVLQGQLHFLDLYTSEKRAMPLPANKGYTNALVGNGLLYFFSKNKADVYTWQ
ncbi:hypothetical protein ACXYMU_02270 [Pontibacter sp. CAU 1760]